MQDNAPDRDAGNSCSCEISLSSVISPPVPTPPTSLVISSLLGTEENIISESDVLNVIRFFSDSLVTEGFSRDSMPSLFHYA